jgi:hypothetical protein
VVAPTDATDRLQRVLGDMRAAVLVRLARNRRLWCNPSNVSESLQTRSDADVWASIVEQNSGLIGAGRRVWMWLWRRGRM